MKTRLLFADDSLTMQKVVQLALEHEDFDLKIVGDGDAALEYAVKESPDILVADVSMPGMDGFELCRKIKENPDTAPIKVVLMSGEMEEYDEEAGSAAGASGHLTKPFKSAEFIETIKKIASPAQGGGMVLELITKAVDQETEEGDLEVVTDEMADGPADLNDPLGLDLKLDDDELLDIENDILKLGVDEAPDRKADVSGSGMEETEKILDDIFDTPKAKADDGLESPEAGDEFWKETLKDLGKDASAQAAKTETSAQPVAPTPSVGGAELERQFREAAQKAVNEFLSEKAAAIFREEMSKGIGANLKEIFDSQFEKAFREEISRVVAEGFAKAMPQMLEIMENITTQITPKIAEQMIKTAIEQIKGGGIN